MPGRPPFAVLVVPYVVELDGGVTRALFRAVTGEDRAWSVLRGDGVGHPARCG